MAISPVPRRVSPLKVKTYRVMQNLSPRLGPPLQVHPPFACYRTLRTFPSHPVMPLTSTEYNVGLALVRLSNIIDGGTDDDATPGKTLGGLIVDASEQGEHRRCMSLVPAWWPSAFDPATGKLAA